MAVEQIDEQVAGYRRTPDLDAGRAARGVARGLGALLTAGAWGLYVLGVTLPMVSVQRLRFWTDEPSLIELIAGVIESGDLFLAIVVMIFSIIFPVLKLGYLSLAAIAGPERAPRAALDHIGWLGKWSMMDVLLVAIAVFAAKTSGFASAISMPGLQAYAGAVIASAFAAELLKASLRKPGGQAVRR